MKVNRDQLIQSLPVASHERFSYAIEFHPLNWRSLIAHTMPLFGSFPTHYPVFWANLGLGVLGAALIGRVAVRYWREEAEYKPSLPKTQYITQDTEDSLQLKTLDTLLGHYNFLIRDSSAKIICDRAVNDGTSIEILLWGITNPDYEERMKNLRALAVITDPSKSQSPASCIERLNQHPS